MTRTTGARFADTTVLVTGGAHGIGRACASRLAGGECGGGGAGELSMCWSTWTSTSPEPRTLVDTEDDVWNRMLGLNLLSVVRCCRAAIPHLRHSGRSPAIVSVTSVNGLTAMGSEPYSAAKAGVGSLTSNLASSLAAEGIRVNAVAPATIRTRVWDGQDGGAERLRGLYPLGRIGEPDDVAAAVAFLASDDAAWITGHTLPVDGGLLAGLSLP